MIRALACALLIVLPLPGLALDLSLPQGARALASRISPLDSYELPVGPYRNEQIDTRRFEGRVERSTWQIEGSAATTLQLLAPLREQIDAGGFDLLFDCKDSECGGFDFRFGTEVVPAPDMHVDIRNYRFLAASRGDAEAISVLVSRNRNASYIQVIQTFAVDPGQPGPSSVVEAAPDVPTATLGATLMRDGHVVLSDLDFGSGTVSLTEGSYDSLAALAAFLAANPGARIALVGHTDSIGALDQNIALSKRRAQSVRTRLVGAHGADPARIDAEGMGYLAPVASNLTEAGRLANRRVEAILLSDR